MSKPPWRRRNGLMTTEGYLSSAEAPPKPSRSHIKTRALWAVALLVGILGFASGRMTSGIRLLPALAGTLPGDEPEFSREIDERVRELFPAGDQRKKDSANAATFVWTGLFCTKIARAIWRHDSSGPLIETTSSCQTQCVCLLSGLDSNRWKPSPNAVGRPRSSILDRLFQIDPRRQLVGVLLALAVAICQAVGDAAG